MQIAPKQHGIRQRPASGWRSAVLGGVLATCSVCAHCAVALLTYQPFFEPRDLVGTPVSFNDSTLVTRLQTLDPSKSRAQIATELQAAVDARLQAMFAGLNLRFTSQVGGTDAIIGAFAGQLYFDRAATGDKTAGRSDVAARRAIVVVDEFDIDRVFIPPPPAYGYIRRLEMHSADTAPHNEVANAMAKTIAHEVGHLFGLAGDVNRAGMTIQPEPGNGPVLGPQDKVTTNPDFGVMAQGLMILPTEFSADEKKFLGKVLGTTAGAGVPAQAPRLRDVIRVGDIDRFGTGETGVQRDMALAQSLATGRVVSEADDAAGTDTVLAAGTVEFVFLLTSPVASDLESAFLQVSLLNAGSGSVQHAWLRIGGVDLDLGDGFADLDAEGITTSVLLDLGSVPGALDRLRGAPSFGVRLELASAGVAIDYLQFDAFGHEMPEPSTLALLTLMLPGLAVARRRGWGPAEPA